MSPGEAVTEFVLARTAEDQAVARYGEDDWDLPDGIAFTAVGLGSDRLMVHTISRSRALAQCEAVRRIVEMETADRNGRVYPINPRAVEVIRALATIWRDHPDYDTDWEA